VERLETDANTANSVLTVIETIASWITSKERSARCSTIADCECPQQLSLLRTQISAPSTSLN